VVKAIADCGLRIERLTTTAQCAGLYRTLHCRHGIKPSSMNAGAFVILKQDAAAVMALKKADYR
jgi:hypothetical protein